jgi:long-chain acyl-CoA synthetase
VLITEDEEQLDKVLAVRERLPALKHIVVIDPRGVRSDDVLVFDSFEEGSLEDYAQAVARLEPSSPAILVYTSGTTGPPKGALISHANLVASGSTYVAALGSGQNDEVLSYLPLCHIAERLVSVIDAIWAGSTVNFGEGGEAFPQDLRDVQPTVFLGVPRVWEKMMAGVEIRMADASWLKRTVYKLCLKQGKRIAPRRMAGKTTVGDKLMLGVCELVMFRPLRLKLGMSRVRVPLSGAAPIAPQVLEYLWAIGIPVREGYGQTENTAICTITPVGDIRLGTVGRALPGVEVRIADDGEILTRSAGIFLGYLDDPDATAATVDADGWLHTGDVGEIDKDGFLKITDRKKDIIITAGGKNVSPSEIENLLKVSPYVREAVVVGDRRKYLTALIGIELDTVGNWATRRDLPYTTYADLSDKPEVYALIRNVVSAANNELAQVEQVKRFVLIGKELDHEDGELTATQKVKRKAIERRFESEIEAMYQ